MRSASAWAKSRSCVTKQIARPSSRSDASRSRSSSHVRRSCPNVGSSSTSTRGRGRQRRRHREAPLLPAREREGVGGGQSRQSQSRQQLVGPTTRRARLDAGKAWSEQQLVDDPAGQELVLRILEHGPDARDQLARRPTGNGIVSPARGPAPPPRGPFRSSAPAGRPAAGRGSTCRRRWGPPARELLKSGRGGRRPLSAGPLAPGYVNPTPSARIMISGSGRVTTARAGEGQVRNPDSRSGEPVAQTSEQLAWRALCADTAPRLEDHHAVDERQPLRDAMLHQHEGDLPVLEQPANHPADGCRSARVEVRGRFVKQ